MTEIKLIELGTEQKITVRGYELPGDGCKRYAISKYYYQKLMDLITSGALIRSCGEDTVLRYRDEVLFMEGENNAEPVNN